MGITAGKEISGMMKRISFIGVGIMGKSMVRNLMKAGYELHVYARVRAKAEDVIREGAVFHESIADCVAAGEVLITMVGFPADVGKRFISNREMSWTVRSGTCI